MSAAAAPSLLHSRVRITGLVARPDLNASEGRAVLWHEEKGRYAVQLDAGGRPILVRADNLIFVPATPAEQVLESSALLMPNRDQGPTGKVA